MHFPSAAFYEPVHKLAAWRDKKMFNRQNELAGKNAFSTGAVVVRQRRHRIASLADWLIRITVLHSELTSVRYVGSDVPDRVLVYIYSQRWFQ